MSEAISVTIPEYLEGAAFLVKDYVIVETNTAAQKRQFSTGTNVRSIIDIGATEYDSFRSGKLYLQLTVAGNDYNACVTCYQGLHLFCILSDFTSKELQVLALIATHLKEPLQNVFSGMEQLYKDFPDSSAPAPRAAFGQINRGLHQLYRSIGNMSDASGFPAYQKSAFAYTDVKSFFSELIEKINIKLKYVNRTFAFSGLSRSVYTMLDGHSLERALHNLISNAVKFSPESSQITVKISFTNSRIYITVENKCPANSLEANQFFDRYLREPEIEDSRFGIGLGLSVIRNIATAHHGTLLIQRKNKTTVNCTMTLAVVENSVYTLRSPSAIKIEPTGGFDLSALELSDILPDSLYEEL